MVKEISAADLSRECRDYMCVKVERPKQALDCLKQHINMDSSEIADGELHLLNARNGRAVNACLAENGFIASEISFHQLDLEEYFMNLMGGAQNA